MKQGMSIFQMILLGAFGAFAVAGVLIFAFLVGTNSGSSLGPVTVWGTFDETAMTVVLRQLSENDDRLRQVSYIQKNPETFEIELTNALAAGTGPDLYILRNDYTIMDTPKIMPIPPEQLTSAQFSDLFIEAAEPYYSAKGALAIPLAVDPLVMYWNRDLFANAGVARPPSYWDEAQEVARAVTRRDDSGVIVKSGIALGEFANIDHAKLIVSTLMLQAGSPVTARDTAGNLQPAMSAQQGSISQPAQNALSFYTAFANPAVDVYTWNRTQAPSRTAFSNGDLGIYIGLASDEALIRRQNPNLNFAVAPLPQIRGIERQISGGYSYGFAIPLVAQNPQGALTAAYLLATPEGSRAIALALGFASARRDALSSTAEGNEALYNKAAIQMRVWEDPDPQASNTVFRDMIQSVTSGAAKVGEAVQRGDAAMREVIQ